MVLLNIPPLKTHNFKSLIYHSLNYGGIMKRHWLIFFTVVFLLAGMVLNISATETRVFSMGQTGLFMYDNSNIVFFPGAVMRYGNEIVTELRMKDAESLFSAEIRLPMNSYMFGLNFNRPITLFDPGVGQSISLNSTSDLYFGTKLGGNDLGIRLSLGRDGFARDSIPFGPPRLEESARYFEVAGGYSTDLFDASLSLELPSVKSEEGSLTDEFSGNMIMLNGRYFYDYDAKMTFVPVVRLGFGSGSRKTDVGGGNPQEEIDYGLLSLNLGIGLNYQISENSLLIFAIDPYGYSRLKEDEKNVEEYTETRTTLPRLYLGAETTIKSWLTGRVGANRGYQKVTQKFKPTGGTEYEQSYQESPYNVSFGLGLKFGRFLIDLDINDGFFFEGPNFISGTFRDFSNRVSISYLFGNDERSKK